ASLIQADASDRTRVEGAAGLPPGSAGRAVDEYLAVLDDAAFGAATEVTPKFTARADPATRWTAAHRGPAFFAYSTNYLIDVDNTPAAPKIYRMPRPLVHDNGMMRYRASKLDCERCSLKPRCCPNAPARK